MHFFVFVYFHRSDQSFKPKFTCFSDSTSHSWCFVFFVYSPCFPITTQHFITARPQYTRLHPHQTLLGSGPGNGQWLTQPRCAALVFSLLALSFHLLVGHCPTANLSFREPENLFPNEEMGFYPGS